MITRCFHNLHRFLAAIFVIVVFMAVLPGCSRKKPESPADKYAQHYSLGINAYRSGKYHAALRYFDKALTLEPEDPDLYLTMATIYDDCLNDLSLEEHKKAKRKAVEYYEKFIEKTEDSTKKERAREWLDICRRELVALDAGVFPEHIGAEDAIERDKIIENLEASLAEIVKKYSLRLDKVHELESKISELNEANRELAAKVSGGKTESKPISLLAWGLLGLLGLVVFALAWSLRHTPAVKAAGRGLAPVERKPISADKIIGSYVWVESVHNRGMMTIDSDEQGLHVQTRAINTSAKSSGHGKYENNVLEANLADDSGEGAVMRFEFFEEGRTFIASWEDELGHGSAVGLRNEFDEMVRPDTRETKADE